MYREILTVKNKKLIPNSFYRTWKIYDGVEKGVRMREMTKRELMIESLYKMVDNLSFAHRLQTFEDLVRIWRRLKEDSDEQDAIAEVVRSFCHRCGGNCRMVTDEEHGEDFIVCNGDVNCINYGDETEGIAYFDKRLKK